MIPDDNDEPDCTELLDSFVELAGDIAPGDTLIITLENSSASIEILLNGISVFKQQRGSTSTTPKSTKATDKN